MFKYLEKRRKIKQTIRELHSLNDRELADIGITRCDIYRVARESV